MQDVESAKLDHIKSDSVITLLTSTLDSGPRLFSHVPTDATSGFQAFTAFDNSYLSYGSWMSVLGLKSVSVTLQSHWNYNYEIIK